MPISPRPTPDYPPRSPISTPLNRYQIIVNCRITITVDAPDTAEAQDRAGDELDAIGDVSNINFPGQPTLVEANVGTTG